MKKIYPLLIVLLFNVSILWGQRSLCSLAKTASLNKTEIASSADVEKMNNYDVYYYKLDVAVERNTTYISGNVEIHANVVKDLTEFVFELHDTLLIDSVLLEGERFAYSRLNGVITVITNRLAGTKLIARIVYHGFTPQGQSAAIGNGFSNSLSPQEVTWSLSQPYAAYEWWPCKQVLTDKADSAEIWITTDATNKVGSNGLLVNTVSLPNNKTRYEWKTHYPIDYYLLSVAVANYEEYNLYAHPVGATQPILIQNYIYDTAVKKAIDYTPQLIEMYSPLYGMYPFALEKYGHSQANINGGMEHQTMTTLGAFSFNVIAHELAHQWFGDYVTCGSWADIWLNEGFASYSEYISNEQLATGNAPSWMNRAMDDAKATPESVYVLDTPNVDRIFDGLSTYHKGAVLLHMIRYEINNDSIFFLGLRNYLEVHKFSTALGTDFRKVMEQTSGKEFGYFFDQWYYGKGYPVFSANWNQINNKFYVNLTQTSTNNLIPLFKTTIDIRIIFTNGDTTIRVWNDSLSKIYSLDVTGKTVTGMQLDANNWILNDVGTIKKDPLFNAIPNINGENDILVYPNPVSDILHITNANGCLVEVFDIAGKKQLNMLIGEQNDQLELSDLKQGVYILRIKKSGSTKTLKLVKN